MQGDHQLPTLWTSTGRSSATKFPLTIHPFAFLPFLPHSDFENFGVVVPLKLRNKVLSISGNVRRDFAQCPFTSVMVIPPDALIICQVNDSKIPASILADHQIMCRPRTAIGHPRRFMIRPQIHIDMNNSLGVEKKTIVGWHLSRFSWAVPSGLKFTGYIVQKGYVPTWNLNAKALLQPRGRMVSHG
ncbi:hypothetical protein ASF71_15530 [Deinococcus sp. Leaf326]|nr:hypothetical protein ASF71_15530 [Deinococcus sp. Leaf326]